MTATVAPAAPPTPAASNNELGALITFAAQGAGATNSSQQENPYGLGVKVVVDITAISGTGPTLTVAIRGYDRTSGKTWTLLSSAALGAVATTVLTLFPGSAVAANLSANDHLPATWDVLATIGGTSPSVTATISAQVLQ